MEVRRSASVRRFGGYEVSFAHRRSCRKTLTPIKNIMKLKKRKIKYSAIFFLCWFTLLVFLVDGVLKFQTLVDYLGSYILTEIILLLLVIIPTIVVYKLSKE